MTQIETWKCRSCLEGVGLRNIYEVRIDNFLLCEIIKFCTNEEISFNKDLPSNLCNLCFEKFRETYFFIKEFRRIQRKFKNSKKTSLNSYEDRIDIDDEFQKYLNKPKTGTERPSTDDVNTNTDEITKFLDEFEIKTDPNSFKKKFRKINPIFQELCITLAENRKQLLRPDPKNTFVPLKPYKKKIANDAVQAIKDIQEMINGAKDSMSVPVDKLNKDGISKDHIDSHTTNEAHESSNCGTYSGSPNIPEESFDTFLSQSNTNSRKEPNTQCFECLTVFRTGAELKRHSRETGHDIAPKYKCSTCGKFFKFRHVYRSHVKQHVTCLQDSVCEICGACVRTTNLPRHMERHEGGNTCPECGKQFTQKAYLAMHMKKHQSIETTRKELCHICGVQRTNLSGLNKHMNEKHGEATNWSHKCEICNVLFFSKFSLKLHVQKMHEQKSVCKKISTRIYSGRPKKRCNDGTEIKEEGDCAEKRKPVVKKIMQCSICLKHMTASTLYHHMRIHKGLKPYQCKVCLKSFRQCHHLKSHMNIHLDLKPYQCEYCKKCFRHQTTLIIHKRSHTGETPYVCRFCSKGFAHSSSMKKHEEIHFKKALPIMKIYQEN